MDRKLSDIKKLEILKKQVEVRKIQASNIMASTIFKLKLTVVALLTIVLVLLMSILFEGKWSFGLVIMISFVSIFVLCISGIVVFFNIISTLIIKILQFRYKHVNVRNTNKIKLTATLLTIIFVLTYVLAYIFIQYKYGDINDFKYVIFVIPFYGAFIGSMLSIIYLVIINEITLWLIIPISISIYQMSIGTTNSQEGMALLLIIPIIAIFLLFMLFLCYLKQVLKPITYNIIVAILTIPVLSVLLIVIFKSR